MAKEILIFGLLLLQKGPPREGMQRIQTRLHKAKILTDEL
jgi:hypothetical protein